MESEVIKKAFQEKMAKLEGEEKQERLEGRESGVDRESVG